MKGVAESSPGMVMPIHPQTMIFAERFSSTLPTTQLYLVEPAGGQVHGEY